MLQRFDLTGQVKRFHRCPTRNGFIQPVDKNVLVDKLDAIIKASLLSVIVIFPLCISHGFYQGPGRLSQLPLAGIPSVSDLTTR